MHRTIGVRTNGRLADGLGWLAANTEAFIEQSDVLGGKQSMATATKSKKTSTKLQPLGDRVVVERDEGEETTAGGIVLPDTAKDKPSRGAVISIGDGRLLEDGSRSPLQVKAGDRVLFTSYAPETVKIGEDELLLMREEDILAVIG
jgi:chaperonin GroES